MDDLDATDDPTGWTGTNIQSFVHLVDLSALQSGQASKRAVNGAGITVEKLVLAPLAAGYGVLDPEERKAEVVLLDIGAMTTDIAGLRHGVLWHSDLMPSGGRATRGTSRSGCGPPTSPPNGRNGVSARRWWTPWPRTTTSRSGCRAAPSRS